MEKRRGAYFVWLSTLRQAPPVPSCHARCLPDAAHGPAMRLSCGLPILPRRGYLFYPTARPGGPAANCWIQWPARSFRLMGPGWRWASAGLPWAPMRLHSPGIVPRGLGTNGTGRRAERSGHSPLPFSPWKRQKEQGPSLPWERALRIWIYSAACRRGYFLGKRIALFYQDISKSQPRPGDA